MTVTRWCPISPGRPGLVFVVWAVVSACNGDGPDRSAPDSGAARDSAAPEPPPVVLIDSTIPPAVAGEGGWNYRQSVRRDLNADGVAELVVLTARVEMYRGQPAWDDGQPWQVYVEEQDGRRTYLYAQRLQLGTLTMRVTRRDAQGRAGIILLEQLPDRMSAYEVVYHGPSRAEVVIRFQRELDATGDTGGVPLAGVTSVVPP